MVKLVERHLEESSIQQYILEERSQVVENHSMTSQKHLGCL